MDKKLSYDIWLIINDIKGKQELSSLSRTSKHLMNTLRPVLYQLVDLRMKDRRPSKLPLQTLILLSEDRTLASCVQEFRIGDEWYIGGSSDYRETGKCAEYFLRALSNMASLQSLYVDSELLFRGGPDFYTLLLHVLQSREQPIHTFELKRWDPSDELRLEDCFLQGLRVFKCAQCIFRRKTVKPLFKLAFSSHETLHTLQLPMNVLRGYYGRPYSLWKIRFSHLKHLILNEWDFWLGDFNGHDSFRDFLLSHPDLLISSLKSDSVFSSAIFANFGGQLGFTSLSLTLYQLKEAERMLSHFGFLKRLHTLKIFQGNPRPYDFVPPPINLDAVMAMILSKTGDTNAIPLYSLQHLTFVLVHVVLSENKWIAGDSKFHAETTKMIHNFGQICGSKLQSITIWLTKRNCTDGDLAFAFSAYPHLEEITIRELEDDQYREKYASTAKAIASHCPNLKRLTFKKLDEESLKRLAPFSIFEKLDEDLDKRAIVSLRIERHTGEGIVVTTDFGG